jgi:predicted DCC family thiol-disulfide oxidoreductase YuxK
MSEPPRNISIVYDGECPLCQGFFRLYKRLQHRGFEVELVDARGHPSIVEQLRNQHEIDLDQDFAVSYNGAWLKGAPAMMFLFGASALPNRRYAKLISISSYSIYAALRQGRYLLLWSLRRQRLRSVETTTKPVRP